MRQYDSSCVESEWFSEIHLIELWWALIKINQSLLKGQYGSTLIVPD